MPGSLQAAVSNGVFPTSLSTKFSESHAVQLRANEYHDGTQERNLQVSQSRRTWTLSKRLTPTDLSILRDFWETNQNTAFQFYNPVETSPPFTKFPTGAAGLYLVRFNSDWNETVDMVRSDVSVELIEAI